MAYALMEMPDPVDISVGKCFKARSTHLIDPMNFYVLPIKYEKIKNDIQQPGTPFESSELPEIGSTVIYESARENTFIRGTIEQFKADEGKYQVYALDRGFYEEDVEINSIFHPINDEAMLMPPLVFNCELYMCKAITGEEFDNEAIEAFKYFMLPNEVCLVHVIGKNNNKLKVTVYNSNPKDIATLLACTNFTLLAYSQSDTQEIPNYDWKYRKLSVGDKMKIRVLHGSSFQGFFVSTEDGHKDYELQRYDFDSYCQVQPQMRNQSLKVGRPVGVLEHLKLPYERAVITRINGPNSFNVRLIDFGNEITVGYGRLKAINTTKFCQTPARAIYCTATEEEAWDSGLSEIYKGYAFTIEVKRAGHEHEVPNVVSLSK